MKAYGVCAIALACVTFLSLAGCRKHSNNHPGPTPAVQATPVLPPHNPPVVIVGGSIHGTYGNKWSPPSGTTYEGTTASDSTLYFVHVYDGGGNAVAELQAPSGWIVKIYDQHSDKTQESSAGAQLCSDPGCEGTSEDGTSAYFQSARSNTGLELFSSTTLHFHNYDNDCDHRGSGHENKYCDHIHHLGVVLAGGSETRYDSGGHQGIRQGKCQIWVGQVPSH